MKVVLWPSQECELKTSVVMTSELAEGKCVALLVSHSYDMPERRNISRVELVAAVQSPCIRCMVTGKDIIRDQMDHGGSLRERQKWLKKMLLNIKRNKILRILEERVVRSC